MARIVQIGKRRWIAGLRWSSFEDKPTREELKEEAERFEATWSCLRIGDDAIQAGFCAPVEGAKQPIKLFSLAAMLADSREQPWLGIFKIEEGVWWYVAVRDRHAILPDGDVIGGEAEIHAARERHAGYADWKYIEGDINLLAEFISEIDAKPTAVRSFSGPALPALPVVMSGVILVSLLGGGAWWYQKQQQEEQERLAAMERMRAQLAASQPPVPVASPLLTTPEPNVWLAACGNVVSAQPLSKSGWVVSGVACDASAALVIWSRTEGATVARMPEGNLSAVGDRVDQVIPLAGLKAAGKDDAANLATAKLTLRAWAQAAGFALTLSDPPAPQTLPGADPSQIPKPVPQSVVSIDIPVSPFGFDMNEIPGLRLTGLRTTETGWKMEGTLYGR